jgi:hypothetical protein
MIRLRNRAEELRTIAEGMSDPKSREALLKWAEEYDDRVRGLTLLNPPAR